MDGRVGKEIKFVSKLWKLGISSAIEYRASFIIQVFSTFINDVIYFLFWLIFFDKMKIIVGYNLQDMLLQFSIVTTGFGIAFALFGNISRIPILIVSGNLESFLIMPRNVLLNLISSRVAISAVGDAVFGIMVLFFALKINIVNILLWLIAVLSVAAIFIAFYVILGSLSFWIGNSQGLVGTIGNALITFALYPSTIFSGVAKIILFSLIPAGFIGIVPMNMIRYTDMGLMIKLIGFSVFISVFAIVMFYRGLRRYEPSSAVNLNM